MKIVHISDLHIDAVYKRTNYKKTMQLLGYAVDNGFDHMVISGDLTENAEKSAFQLVRRMLKRFGLLNPAKLSIVIGNHDIFGGVHLAEDILQFPKKCKSTDYNNKVSEFTSYFNETFEKTIRGGQDIFPYAKEFDNAVIFGFNSISRYSVFKNPFASNGDIDEIQLSNFEKMLSSEKLTNRFGDKIKIVISHHHFCKSLIGDSSENTVWQKIEQQTMKLRNKKSIIKLFKKHNVQLVLHGHMHETAEYTRKGIKFLNAGGSILGNNPDEINLNYIYINPGGIQTEIQTVPLNSSNASPVRALQSEPKNYKEFSFSQEICLN
jgi:Icc protein